MTRGKPKKHLKRALQHKLNLLKILNFPTRPKLKFRKTIEKQKIHKKSLISNSTLEEVFNDTTQDSKNRTCAFTAAKVMFPLSWGRGGGLRSRIHPTFSRELPPLPTLIYILPNFFLTQLSPLLKASFQFHFLEFILSFRASQLYF